MFDPVVITGTTNHDALAFKVDKFFKHMENVKSILCFCVFLFISSTKRLRWLRCDYHSKYTQDWIFQHLDNIKWYLIYSSIEFKFCFGNKRKRLFKVIYLRWVLVTSKLSNELLVLFFVLKSFLLRDWSDEKKTQKHWINFTFSTILEKMKVSNKLQILLQKSESRANKARN